MYLKNIVKQNVLLVLYTRCLHLQFSVSCVVDGCLSFNVRSLYCLSFPRLHPVVTYLDLNINIPTAPTSLYIINCRIKLPSIPLKRSKKKSFVSLWFIFSAIVQLYLVSVSSIRCRNWRTRWKLQISSKTRANFTMVMKLLSTNKQWNHQYAVY